MRLDISWEDTTEGTDVAASQDNSPGMRWNSPDVKTKPPNLNVSSSTGKNTKNNIKKIFITD